MWRSSDARTEAAEQEADRRQREARRTELSAELDRVDAFLAQQRQGEYEEWNREYDRRQEMTRQLHELANAELPHVPRSI